MKRSMSQNEELHYNINVRCVGGWPSPTLYMSCYGEIKWASTRKLKKKKKKKKKVNFQIVFFAITLVIINGHTCKLFENIINDVQIKGNGGDKYSFI